MNILISINLGNSFSAGVCVNGFINLCDGKANIITSGTTYISNHIVSMSSLVHSVNLKHGGNVEDYEDFSFDMVDGGLMYALEAANLSFNSGFITISTNYNDPNVYKKIWSGYVIGTELGENIVTVKCENLSKALKVMDKPAFYGHLDKLKISEDATIAKARLKFIVNQDLKIESYHPILSEVGSPILDSAVVHGLTQVKTTSGTYIKISYYNKFPFTEHIDSNGNVTSRITLTFISGGNAGKTFRISKITTQSATDGVNTSYNSTLTLLDDFTSKDIKNIDRIEISDKCKYYQLDQAVTTIDSLSVNIDGEYYDIGVDFYDIVTINSIKYIRLYYYDGIYKRVPLVDYGINYWYWTGDGPQVSSTPYTAQTISNIFDNDLSNVFYFNVNTVAGTQDVTIDLRMKFDLSTIGNRTIYLGNVLESDANTLASGMYYIQYQLRVDLNDGTSLFWPNGYSTIKEVIGNPNAVCKIMATPFGGRVTPKTTGENLAQNFNYYFDEADFESWKIDIDPSTYADISNIYFRIYVHSYDKQYVSPAIHHKWRNIGLYVSAQVDDISDIFINVDRSTYSSNDYIAQQILTSISATPSPNFHYSTSATNYNHFSSTVGTPSLDALSTLSKEGMFVIASDAENTIYSNELKPYTTDSAISLTISASDILEIEPLKEVELSDIINLPTISFTDSAGNTESAEIISLDYDFPTFILSAGDNAGIYSKIYKFSDNFYSKLVNTSNPLIAFAFLLDVYIACQNSYKKNSITTQGTIDFETIYLENVTKSTDAYNKILNLVKLNSQKRKTITLTVSNSFYYLNPLLLGSRVKFFHPKIFDFASLYGFVSKVDMDPLEGKTKVSLILDTFKNNAGDTDFF